MSHTKEYTILKTLSAKDPDGAEALGDLRNITAKYPAFGVAKYLLVKNMLRHGTEGVEKYAQNTVLYFPDPFWFHFKLNEEKLMQDETVLQTSDEVTIDKYVDETLPDTITSEESQEELLYTSMAAEAVHEPQADHATVYEVALEDLVAVNNETIEPSADNATVYVVPLEDADKINNEAYQPSAADAETGEIATAEINEIIVAPLYVAGQTEANNVEANGPMVHEAAGAFTHVEEPLAENMAIIEVPADIPPIAVMPAPITAQPKFVFDDTAEDGESDGSGETEEEMETHAQPFNNARINTILQEQLADYNKPVEKDAPVPIENEPYHTVDYFASQGIKLTQEQQAQDHISVKVKKFTDWLKQMKRIAPQPTDLGIDEAAEHKVKNIAAGSNQAGEVVTETMAEVLVKQGMYEKAIEVYEKLSFLYPAKSAYFATQIEHLKTT